MNKVSIFVYGTLLDLDVLEIVTKSRNHTLTNATLLGHKAVYAKDEDFPILVRESKEKVEGKILTISDQEQLKRIKFYEDEEEYDFIDIVVETDSGKKNCFVFFPTSKINSTNKPWFFKNWSSAINKEAYLKKLRDYMKYINTDSPPKW